MLTRATDTPPFFSNHYVTGVWSGWEWALNLGLAALAIVLIAWVVPLLIDYAYENRDGLETWVEAVLVVFAIVFLGGGMVLFGYQYADVINHLPATSYWGKFWVVAVSWIVAAALQTWALLQIKDSLLQGYEGSWQTLAVPVGLGAGIPFFQSAWVMLATIHFWSGFTVLGAIAVGLVVVGIIWASEKSK